MLISIVSIDFLSNQGYHKDIVIQCLNEHNNNIINNCSSNKLLIYDIKDGWLPLCKFLNKPIPDIPFPYMNDNNDFQRLIRIINYIGYILLISLIVVFTCITSKLLYNKFIPL